MKLILLLYALIPFTYQSLAEQPLNQATIVCQCNVCGMAGILNKQRFELYIWVDQAQRIHYNETAKRYRPLARHVFKTVNSNDVLQACWRKGMDCHISLKACNRQDYKPT